MSELIVSGTVCAPNFLVPKKVWNQIVIYKENLALETDFYDF